MKNLVFGVGFIGITTDYELIKIDLEGITLDTL